MFEKLKNLFKEECDVDESEDSPVFVGTTAELLALSQQQAQQAEVAPQEETCNMTGKCDDKVWLNLEFLKMALEIEASKNQKLVFYVDVGNLPKTKAEEYVKRLMEQHNERVAECSDYWLPRRDGGRGTELNSLPGRVTLDGVLDTAKKLKDFATE
jgi:hypothetical protein